MTGSKFQLHYFPLHGLCIPIRALLSIGEVDWNHKFQSWDDWPEVKPKTPFGTLPVLTETAESSETIEIPEAAAIERYLARKFDMAGSTEAERVQVDVAISLYQQLGNAWAQTITSTNEETPKYLEELKTKHVPQWVASCEKMLVNNGSNGHFVGTKLTHADVCASAMMDYMLAVEGLDSILNEKAAPNLFACKRKVDSNPSYLAYRRSEEFGQMTTRLETFCNTKLPFDMKKSNIVA